MLPPCSHRPPCPSCPSYGVALSDKDGTGALRALSAQHGVPLSLLEGPPLAYRHRARLAVRGRSRSPKVGVFQLATHRIVDIPNCRVHHPAINRAARVVKDWIRTFDLAPYAEQGHRGLIRYVQCSVSPEKGGVQLVVVCNDDATDPERIPLGALADAMAADLHSLFLNGQPERSNAILGPHFTRVSGPECLVEQLGGAQVYFPPDAFAQANMPLFSRVVERIHGAVPAGKRLLELYAGVGAIGLGLAERSLSLVCNEVADGSLRGLALGVAALPAELQNRVQVRPGPAASCIGDMVEADVVIADPPRKGLEPEVLAGLLAHRPGRFIYLSCGLSSFLRDAALLLSEGAYHLTQLEAIDLFPQTEHIETLAVFDAR